MPFGNRKSVRVPRELARASNERDHVEEVTGSEATFPSWRGLLRPFFSPLASAVQFLSLSLSPVFFFFPCGSLPSTETSFSLFLFDRFTRFASLLTLALEQPPLVLHRRETTRTFPFTIRRETRGATAPGFDKRLRLFSGFPG